MWITDEEIKKAKSKTKYMIRPVHTHYDSIRAAYQWFDAQIKLRGSTTHSLAIKHIIEQWAGFYITQSDAEVAAHLHPDIFDEYPYYNVHCNTVHASDCRLIGLIQHRTNAQSRRYNSRMYFERVDPFSKRIYITSQRRKAYSEKCCGVN